MTTYAGQDADMPADLPQARDLRLAMAEALDAAGKLPAAWRGAVEAVPRHLLVPRYYEQDAAGRWQPRTVRSPGYLADVYADRVLTTQLDGNVPTSSSTQPALMLAMLDALEVADGHTVLEIGTGTGYNAALLAHRLGSAKVTTVDVDPKLTRAAAARLAAAGYRPVVRTGDGARGIRDRAPYDRAIATCELRRVPWPWIEQAADSAVLVVPIGAGLARLRVRGGQVSGRFLSAGAHFMPRRTAARPAPPRFASLRTTVPTRTSVAVAEVLDRLRFPVSLALSGYGSCVWSGEGGGVQALGLWTPDGSVATAHTDGTVRQGGPRRLWDAVEEISELFPHGAVPAREDFGLTLSPDRQRAWFQRPDGPGWELAGAHAR
ncbi:methyltransferase domain-containing protein [Streptomyces sp. NPDC050617]|uniref:methyltransferase domain-containing protein n=1 Tax=Streptomyces sp. NPDC050617 TaxID=3154628 RepID=UPI003414164F